MTAMPTIDDRMVALFRCTGKGRASYRLSGGVSFPSAGPRVVPQRSPDCTRPGQRCDCDAAGNCAGVCDRRLICMVDPIPGGDPFRLPGRP
jgi:hypothetical protein